MLEDLFEKIDLQFGRAVSNFLQKLSTATIDKPPQLTEEEIAELWYYLRSVDIPPVIIDAFSVYAKSAKGTRAFDWVIKTFPNITGPLPIISPTTENETALPMNETDLPMTTNDSCTDEETIPSAEDDDDSSYVVLMVGAIVVALIVATAC